MFKQQGRAYGIARRRRFSPLILVGISVPVVLALIAATVFLLPRVRSHAAGDNMDCTLILPANPLSAQGLATPFQLVATTPANGACHEANKVQAAFVQGAIIDPVTGQVSIYDPLIVDQGTQPAIEPKVPTLPPGAVVALWFGYNGNNLTLQAPENTLNQANCVNGAENSIFGQFAYCNAPAFFAVANQAINDGRLKVPPLGMAKDGKPCPTVRDFGVVDMDQSDNVTTTYLVTGDGKTAQASAANTQALQNQGLQVQVNASDNRLLDVALDGALGCTPWGAPNLVDPNNIEPALPLNELQANRFQAPPVALIPAGDPMVLNNGQMDINKVDMYRNGVGQPVAQTPADADTNAYCKNLLSVGTARLNLDKGLTQRRPSPDPAAANNLFTFLAQRMNATFSANGLNCIGLLNINNPITVRNDANGVAINAVIALPNMGNGNNGGGTNGNNGGGTNGNNGNGTAAAGAPTCVVNGTAVAGCNGTTTINGQNCTLMFDAAANSVNVACPAKQ